MSVSQPKKAPRKRGGPAHKPTDAIRTEVEALSACGLPQHDIARVVGLNHETLRKYYREELDTAGLRATGRVAGKLFAEAMNGNTAAMIFWMKARAGWSEKSHMVHSGDGEPLKVLVQWQPAPSE